MNMKARRNEAVEETIGRIKTSLRDGVNVRALEDAKSVLMELCARRELFPREDFPLPVGEQVYRTFLIYEDEDGEYALYVNSSLPGQQSCPHDHGGSWAIIAAIEGAETHRLYVDEDDGNGTGAELRQVSEILVEPGSAVSMMPDGIHSIHAETDEPLLHLHLYGTAFALQAERRQFDLATGRVKRFVLEEIGLIEDAR